MFAQFIRPRPPSAPRIRHGGFLTASRPEQIPSSYRSRPSWSVVGAPSSLPILTALHADFAVRAYVLDPSGKLEWYGKRPTEMPEGASYAP